MFSMSPIKVNHGNNQKDEWVELSNLGLETISSCMVSSYVFLCIERRIRNCFNQWEVSYDSVLHS